jgi:hypothetical protein
MPLSAQDEEKDDEEMPDGADEDEQAQEASGAPAEQPRAKKQRGNRCEQLVRKVTETENKLRLEQEKARLAAEKGSKTKRDREVLDKLRSKIDKTERALVDLRGELETAQQLAADKAAAEKKRLEKAAEKEEESRNMTEAAAMQLVTIRLKYQYRFDNRSDKADAIWAHIHDDFMKLVEDGTLPQTDGRSAQALEKRFNTELGEFRLWSSTANKAVEFSGVPADQVEEMVRAHWRPTTSLFRKSNYEQRPMSIPPFFINSESAARGGMANNLRLPSSREEHALPDSDDEEHVFATEEAAEEDRQRRAAEKWAECARRDDEASNSAEAGRDEAGRDDAAFGSSSSCSGSAASASGSSAPRSTPPPLHVGGATGKSSRKKQAKESDDLSAMYKAEQEANRKLAQELQDRQEKEGERQRQHEKEMAQAHCRQQ